MSNSGRKFLIGILALSAMLVTGCRLDIDVVAEVDIEGVGTVTVTATADAELARQLPDLADQLATDDLDGWTVTGPEPTPDGGLRVRLSTPVNSVEELSMALARIGPPLQEISVATAASIDTSTLAWRGILRLDDGFFDFADAELLEVVGGLPFADLLEQTQATPTESMSFTMTVAAPGELLETTGSSPATGVYRWEAVLDGSEQALALITYERTEEPPGWARPISTIAFLALLAWLVFSTILVVAIVRARAKRRPTKTPPA
jgi:hypothetical protein